VIVPAVRVIIGDDHRSAFPFLLLLQEIEKEAPADSTAVEQITTISYYAWLLWASPDPTEHLAVPVEDIFGCQQPGDCVAGTRSPALR
jgi:hypothetical protein